MGSKKISYTERDFEGLRQELINFTKQYYPDVINNFNDASIFSVLLDLNAAIGDNLHYHIDRSIQETVLLYAQQKSSIYNIARTYGLKIPGNRPSVAMLDVSIVVPPFGDKEDSRYLGLIRSGGQFSGAGQIFENLDDIDFSSQYDSNGVPNRTKIPNFDSNNKVINYQESSFNNINHKRRIYSTIDNCIYKDDQVFLNLVNNKEIKDLNNIILQIMK